MKNRILLRDPAKLAALLQEFLEPTQRHTQVADTLGIGRSWYSRLRRGLLAKSVTAGTHKKIYEALWPKMPASRRNELGLCFQSHEDKARSQEHKTWLAHNYEI
jgi:hypothetical protein